MTNMKILAVFFAVLAVVAASKPMLFSTVTMFASQNFATADHLVTINPNSGSIGDLMETFFYAGTSTTNDGISAFDFLNGVYYYATDGNSAFVFRGNVKTQTLMSPIAFPLDFIYELSYDVSQQRIIVAGAVFKDGDYLISFPTDESKPWSVIAKLDSDYNFEYGTVDSANQIYYWVSSQTVNQTYSNIFLHSISLTNPSYGSTKVQVMCTPMLYPDTVKYDPIAKQLYVFATELIGSGHNYDNIYYIESVSTTGACSVVKTQIPNGIVTDWAYDPITQNVYAGLAVSNGVFLYTLNIKTGNVLKKVPVGNLLVPESMEFAYV